MGCVAAVKSTGSQPSTRLAVSDKGPRLPLCRKEFLQRQKAVKQSIIKRKRRVQDVWTDTRADSGGEALSRTLVAVGATFMGYLFGFLWPIILIYLVQSPLIGPPWGLMVEMAQYVDLASKE